MGLSAILLPVMILMLKQALKLSWQQIKVQPVNASAQVGSLSWLLKDFRSSSATELGSLLLNGSFETPLTSASPKYWATSVTGHGSFSYNKSSYTSDTIRT